MRLSAAGVGSAAKALGLALMTTAMLLAGCASDDRRGQGASDGADAGAPSARVGGIAPDASAAMAPSGSSPGAASTQADAAAASSGSVQVPDASRGSREQAAWEQMVRAAGGEDAGATTEGGGPAAAASSEDASAVVERPRDAATADPAPEPLPECEALYGGCPATEAGIECSSEPVDAAVDAPHCRCASGSFCLCEATACSRYVGSGGPLLYAGEEYYSQWTCYDAARPLAACPQDVSTCETGERCIGTPPSPPALGVGVVLLCKGQREIACATSGSGFAQ